MTHFTELVLAIFTAAIILPTFAGNTELAAVVSGSTQPTRVEMENAGWIFSQGISGTNIHRTQGCTSVPQGGGGDRPPSGGFNFFAAGTNIASVKGVLSAGCTGTLTVRQCYGANGGVSQVGVHILDGSNTFAIKSSFYTASQIGPSENTVMQFSFNAGDALVIMDEVGNSVPEIVSLVFDECIVAASTVGASSCTGPGSGADGTITTVVTDGVAPYSIVWSKTETHVYTRSGASPISLVDVPAGTYTAVVTDSNGNTLEMDPVVVTESGNSCETDCGGDSASSSKSKSKSMSRRDRRSSDAVLDARPFAVTTTTVVIAVAASVIYTVVVAAVATMATKRILASPTEFAVDC